jgi:hypothetical protein
LNLKWQKNGVSFSNAHNHGRIVHIFDLIYVDFARLNQFFSTHTSYCHDMLFSSFFIHHSFQTLIAFFAFSPFFACLTDILTKEARNVKQQKYENFK